VGTLADISQRLEGVKSPAIIVIGEVVALRNKVQWMEFAAKFDAE
jgi:uroporphyrinogen III methyltransferase/synthase